MNSFASRKMLVPSVAIALLLAAHASASKSSRYDGCDVSVVGAGIGGLYSAWRLAVDTKTVDPASLCIFEAKTRVGGRILSVTDPLPGWKGYTVDLGDSLDIDGGECISGERKLVATRGSIFGLSADGGDADNALSKYGPEIPYVIDQSFQWGPNKTFTKPREPYDFLLGPTSVVSEIRERWDELTSEESYEKAMRIADEIIEAMKGGSYRGASYSEVSLNQAAIAEGLTSEEMASWFQSDWDAGESGVTRMSLLNLGQLYVRYIALFADPALGGPKAMVTPMSGEGRRIGMKVTLDRMKSSLENAGVRIFFKHKVLSLTKGDKSKGESTVDMVFENGKKMRGITRAILNIGKPDLIALGHLSEPMFSASESFKRHVDRLFVYGLSKTYCFWNDAWWMTKLNVTRGRVVATGESFHTARYHDGHVTCEDAASRKGCKGSMLTSYDLGDSIQLSAYKSGGYVSSHNANPYTPLRNADNGHKLIPGNMTWIEQRYFDDLHRQIQKVHKTSMEASGYTDIDEAIPKPAGCIYGDWSDVGAHVEIGPSDSPTPFVEFTRPSANLPISLVNEAWGQEKGWSESSLNSAERMLYTEYQVAKPEWMDEAFYKSVIVNYNQGLSVD